MPLPHIPVGSLFGMLKFLWEPIAKRKRRKNLEGYYLVHFQNSTTPVNNSPERIPNFLRIEISFWKPNTLTIKAKDFDATYRKKWKTWEGTITMMDDKYGKGYYNYLDSNEPGEHEIWFMKQGKIRVRVVDKGRANLKERKDNDPATQQWIKIPMDDPLVPTFKDMLK